MQEGIIWEAVLSGKVTLHELETSYSLDDLHRLISFLNIQSDIDHVLIEKE